MVNHICNIKQGLIVYLKQIFCVKQVNVANLGICRIDILDMVTSTRGLCTKLAYTNQYFYFQLMESGLFGESGVTVLKHVVVA